MPQDRVRALAQAARADGLTLGWALRYLADSLEAGTPPSSSHDDMARRIHQEALALVLYAVRSAYPAGADIPIGD